MAQPPSEPMPSPPLPSAVCFDMDGLLVDTEPLWTLAEQELALRLGGAWSPALKAQVVGTRLETAVPLILEGLGHVPTPGLVAQVSEELLARMVELFARDLPLMPGARTLVGELTAAGIPTALVSSSYRVLVDAVLAATGLGFDVTLAGDEVVRAKPDPEPYATACRRLAVSPSACVVLEDSLAGVLSGQAAGCAVLAVPSVPGVVIPPAPRRRIVSSLADVSATDLGRLLEMPCAASDESVTRLFPTRPDEPDTSVAAGTGP